jgi:photosystem II stability/assembly factor-like uncharacterized protein
MRRFPAIAALLLLAGSAPAAPFFPGDAAVRAVQFADEREGWAVGDDGVIWHSIDGGQTWERQASGVRASLRAVHFLTPYTGWAVGRAELPGGGSRGVVLSTSDGGLTWAPVNTSEMPGLNCVRFFNQRNGIAAGDGTDTFPTGLFTTIDGGRTWKPVPGKRCPGWLAADFADAETGALGGPWSQLATLREGLFGAAEVDPVGGRSIRGLKLSGPFAVAVGQGGLILTSSTSAGLKWGFAVPDLAKEVLAACDFDAVAVHGKHLWVAGRPGTFILHSPDQGRTWEFQKTGQALPLHAVSFLNENCGWAAGEMGTILLTRDGGKTWKVARQGAQRAAVLFVHADAKAVPLDAVALLGGEEGYHTAALRLTCTDSVGTHPRHAFDPEKLAAALRFAGGTVGEAMWQFPIPNHAEACSAEQLLAHWDRLHGGHSGTHLLRQLVLTIRLWRPEVIVTDVARKGADRAETVVVEAAKQAFKLAADPEAFPEQIASLKLAPWSPKKLYALLEKPDPAAVKLPLCEAKPRLGDCPRDFALAAGRLVADRPQAPDERYFSLLATRLDATGDANLFDGINLARGGQARRDLPPIDEETKKAEPQIAKAVQKRRTLEALARGESPELGKPEQVIAQLAPALKEMPGDLGARAAFALADQYARAGQWVLAREAFLVMADQFPNHPLTLDAYRWLVRYQSSSEARRRQELGHFLNYAEIDIQAADPNTKRGNVKGGTEIVRTGATFLLRDHEDARQWFKGSLAVEPRFTAFGPLYANDPALQFCLNSARRQLGDLDAPKKWFARYLSETAAPLGGQTVARGTDAWRDAAMAELWLVNRTLGTSPAKPLAYCPKSAARPTLDGKLDDGCWTGAKPMVFTTTAGDLGEYTTKAWFAYDDEHLYVAVQCNHPAGKRVPPVVKRSRDMDLRAFDRVSILLDLDRDYQTYFQLQIDQRGCLAEDCWGDRAWDPKWFVAVEGDETGWTAEAAIPLAELTGAKITPGHVWAANVVRVVPGRGVQAWSAPADAKPRPEGMGLLQFIEVPKK